MAQTMFDDLSDRSITLPKIRPWSELARIAQLIMELSWIVPWYRSLTQGTNSASPIRVFTLFFVIYLGMQWLTRALNLLNLKAQVRRIILFSTIFVFLLLGLRNLLYFSEETSVVQLFQRPLEAFRDVLVIIPDEFVILIFILLIAFRGISSASQAISSSSMLTRFQVGFVMMVLFILVNTLLTGETPGDLLFLFLLFGLVAVGSARMAVLERLRGGAGLPFDRKWVVGMIGSATAVVLTAYFFSQITGTNYFPVFVQILQIIGALILGLILLALMPIFLLLNSIFNWLVRATQLNIRMPEFVDNVQVMLSNLTVFANQVMANIQQIVPDLRWSKPILLWVAIGGLFLVGLLFLGLRWSRKYVSSGIKDDLDSLFDSGNLLQILRYLLGEQLLAWEKGLERRRKLKSTEQRKAAERIRQIYQELIGLCEELGFIMTTSQTPYEFEEQLEDAFFNQRDSLIRITNAYVKIRYGEYPENSAEVREIEQDWQVIQTAANQILTRNAED